MATLEEPLGTRLASMLYILFFIVWSLLKRLQIHVQHTVWWPRLYPLPAEALDAVRSVCVCVRACVRLSVSVWVVCGYLRDIAATQAS